MGIASRCVWAAAAEDTSCSGKWAVRERKEAGSALQTRGVSHCGLAIYIKKYLKPKEELWKFKYFTVQKYNLQKNLLKETKILQDIITL